MLHLKHHFCLDSNFSILPYEPRFFREVFLFFKKFQLETQISAYAKNELDVNSELYEDFLLSEFGKIILKCDFCYVVYDNNEDKIASFFSFKRNFFMPDSINIELVIYNPSYKRESNFVKSYKKMVTVVKSQKKAQNVTVALLNRTKYESYINFIKRFFGVKLYTRDKFNRPIFTLPDYDN